MYPQGELRRLAAHKAALRRHIARHRADCVTACAQLARPVQWLDRAMALWRRLSPIALIAAVPLGFLIKRTVSPRLKLIGAIVKWAPIIFGAMRGVSAARKARVARTDC